MGLDRLAQDGFGVAAEGADQLFHTRQFGQRLGQQDALHCNLDAWIVRRCGVDHATQIAFGVESGFFRNHATVKAEARQVRYHIGVDAALDQADVERGMVDAGDGGFLFCQFRTVGVQRLQDAGGRFDGVDAGVRHGGVRLLALDRDFQMQAAVVRGGDAVSEAGRDGVVGLAQALLQNPFGTDVAAGLFVIGELQFDGAVENHALFLRRDQGQQRPGIRGEIRLRHGHTAAVHDGTVFGVLNNFTAVGVLAPAEAGRHHVAVGVERDGRAAAAEALAHDQVDGRDHAVGLDQRIRHRVHFHIETQLLQQGLGACAMRGTIAGRIIGRHPHQFLQETCLRGVFRIKEGNYGLLQ